MSSDLPPQPLLIHLGFGAAHRASSWRSILSLLETPSSSTLTILASGRWTVNSGHGGIKVLSYNVTEEVERSLRQGLYSLPIDPSITVLSVSWASHPSNKASLYCSTSLESSARLLWDSIDPSMTGIGYLSTKASFAQRIFRSVFMNTSLIFLVNFSARRPPLPDLIETLCPQSSPSRNYAPRS